MIETGVPPRPFFHKSNFVAHHDFPWEFVRDFAKRGIDVNEPEFGRWIPRQTHSEWHKPVVGSQGGRFNQHWRSFFEREQIDARNGISYTVTEVFDELVNVRENLFPSEE